MVRSKQVYGILRDALGPLLKGHGFKRLKLSQAGWTRSCAEGECCLWFQCNKSGWDGNWGSTFTLEFQAVADVSEAMTLKGRAERIGHLLEGFSELDELRLMNNAVIEALPGTRMGLARTSTLPDGTTFVAGGYIADPAPAIYGRDIWFNYYSLEDLVRWSNYFAQTTLRFIDKFETQQRSPQGAARDRFRNMASITQGSGSRTERLAVLQHFASEEPDDHYRAAAQRWLEQIA